ncbi:STAS domain-containing protein [Streptomyces mangrovisoli]|uniref:Anti-sigma factor antagonist n=1 Tax=Streptomyces mangrovisoli TaxID=1428628 RepID=A0A1J4NPQ9_9ACTN|nr:STAS domain-containing protein [Streptomyces mangrovisoli]OIJ64130.1 hypothetical protein WN71_030535 [Streptomyces mangrovisoli]
MAGFEGRAEEHRLSVAHSRTDGADVLTVTGEIDRDSAPLLLRAAAAGSGAERTVLDFGGVTFMDSSGINALIAAHRTVGERGGRLFLAALRPEIARIIEIVGLDTVILCRDSVGDALKS